MNQLKLYPFKFKPIYKERIWGGQKLREFFGKDIPRDKKIGESWELADLPSDKSVIANGPLAGWTLDRAIRKYPEEVTGDKNFSGAFPLLIKFIDAEGILSVQVHPDLQTCNAIGFGTPKAECWYIISAEKGAVIYKGLKKGITKENFAQAIRDGMVVELLKKIPAKQGQCYFLPAGTVHSAGAGLLIAEIQTPSDTTYRVFDWNRTDETGKARPLHIKEAMESINFDISNENVSAATTGRLVDSEYFKIDKGNKFKNSEVSFQSGQMKCLIIVSGSGIIRSARKDAVKFRAGDMVLIPAMYEGQIMFGEDTQYLTVTI